MSKTTMRCILTAWLLGCAGARAWATPSTQIWIPSADIQAYKTLHLNIDTYLKMKKENDGSRKAPVSMLGPTIGLLPTKKIQAEAGFDVIHTGDQVLDDDPFYLHAKLGTPESAWTAWSPALAVGGYNLGMKGGVNNQDILYGLTARTLPVVGRLSAGYYAGNGDLLIDERGERCKDGLLLSWDRTMKELSDKLWLAVDYQGGRSSLGATSFGFAWAFTEKTSVIFGYDLYNNRNMAGKDTFTLQVDINL